VTPANVLTILRLLLAPVCAWLILEGRDLEATLVFAVAIASDFADGPIARKRGETSAFGALLDHGTDATFVVLGNAALASRELVPSYLAPIIAFAFIQYTLDSKALAGQPLRASRLGRWNGIFYFVVLGTPIIRNSLGWSCPPDSWVWFLGLGLAVTSIVSIGDRLGALYRKTAG